MKIKNKATAFILSLLICFSFILSIDYKSGRATAKAASAPTSASLASSLLGAVSKKSHPYVLYESSDVASLRDKITSGYSKKAYDFTKTTAKKYLSANISVTSTSSGIIGRQLQSYVSYLSIYGMLSGDNSYFEKAAALVNTAVSQGSVEIYESINGELAVSDFGYAYALAYDWLYNYMTSSERSLLKKEMEDIGAYIYTNSSSLNTWGSAEERRKAWNWNAVTHGALGMIAVSLGSHNDWLTLSIERMRAYYTYAVDSTGAAMEGLHYIGYAMNTLAPLDYVIKDYTGVELLDYHTNMQKLPAWSMMMTAPYGNEQAALGQGTKLDNLAATYYIINRYSQSTELWGWERTYNLEGSNTFTSDYQGNGWNVPAIIFYENKSLQKKAPTSATPLVSTYKKGQVVAVDGWSKSSSMMTFTSGYGYSGCWNHPDNNTFTFFAKGESFVIDLGANFKTSAEHNVVQVDGVGMRYEGGSSMVEGKITANKKLGNGALYLKGDNADSYNDSVLTESTRQLLYMGGDTPYIIAFDYAKKDTSKHKYTTSFYTDTASKIEIVNSNTAKITGGNGGAVAYAFVYSKEGASLTSAKTDKTLALVSENQAVSHNQIMLYITANPDGSMPNVNFSSDNSGNITVSIKYYRGEDLYTDVYVMSNKSEPTASTSKASPEKTAYGTIPAEYANKTKYPFAVFKSDKTFVGAYTDWAIDGQASALHSSKAENSIVLMRRNFEYTGSQYNNLSQSNKGIIIDLGGFSFTNTHRAFLAAQKKTNNDTGITVKNGKINIGATALLRIDSGTQSGGVEYKGKNGFDITFDGVEIILTKDAATNSALCYSSFETSDPNMFCNITLNNCKIDLSAVSKALVLFDMSDAHCKLTAKMNGGEIKTSKSSINLTSVTVGNANSTLTFGKIGTAYTAFKVPTGTALPAKTVNGGALTFVKASSDTTTTTYTLYETDKLSFAPKMSITLGNELVMNVYVPAGSIQEFTLGTDKYNSSNKFGGKLVTLDNGESYYLVSVELGSSEAARELKLAATVDIAGNSAKATFTFSIPKYAAKVLANENASGVEKQLARDVLAYIRAAYNYSGFSAHNTAAEIERVNTLIDSIIGKYTPTPTTRGTTVKDNSGVVTDVTLNLDAKPTIRFYVTDTSVTFSVNGTKLNTVSGKDSKGTYVELDVYAYALCEQITFGNGGSYHISNFVTKSVGAAHEALVKAFVKYTESAADYRNAVIGVKN